MDNSPDNPLKTLEEKFPWLSKLYSEKKLLWILAGFLILAGAFTNISSGSAMVIGLGIILIILAIIDPKTIKKLSSKWFSLERHKFSEEEREIATQTGQEEIPPEVKQKLTQIIVGAKKRKDEERAPEDYLVLAGEAWKEKQYEDGLRLAYAGLQLGPKDKGTRASLYGVLGTIYSILESYSLAEKNYRKATQTDDTFSLPYYNLGILYNEQGNYKEAEKAYQKALELNPKDIEARNNLGVLYSIQKNYDEAEKVFHKALELNPGDARVCSNLGNLYSDQENYVEAEKMYQKALKLNPEDARFHYNLGVLYVCQKKYDLAEAEYQKALELDPELKEAQENLEKIRKLRAGDEDSPGQPTLDLGEAKSKESPPQ